MTTGRHAALAGIAIDRAVEVPIGVQLAWALRARIADGRLAPGERLPGLRELAEALGINANTARAVYQRLEQDDLIESRQGTGTFVAGGDGERSAAASRIAAEVARRARTTGVDPREIAAALYVAAPDAASAPPAVERGDRQRVTVERRTELRAQIAVLEQTLSELQTRHPSAMLTPSSPSSSAPRRAGPRLLSVEDLEEVRMELVRRLAEAEPLIQQARLREHEDLEARRAQTARTAAANARTRKSAEKRAAGKQSPPKRSPARRGTSTRATRPGPSTA
jgi:DNA-binding transcriptional regulator YhcF (GntR family)